ncbi:sporulation protein YtxC [Ferviditalea candida]|uniref:Sporulation protein YtxC n=1 Tax=Ferviditalea candida TaxID=3108399 RepID=A0ABU5ZJR2_9BACL|nr:putative sporulation protein YtxC [Paenibacillaceae bacterium T2]
MQLFSIIVQTRRHRLDHLFQWLSGSFAEVPLLNGKVEWELLSSEPFGAIVCKAVLPRFQLQKHGQAVYRHAADSLADYIIEGMEEQLLRGMIVKEFGYEEKTEIEKIACFCAEFLNETPPGVEAGNVATRNSHSRRKSKIVQHLESYLESHTELNLDGFVRFRLQAYFEDLKSAVGCAVDEYLMDKQYQEFISLLKYFVYIQESKIPAAHLMHKGDQQFILLNERMKPIDVGVPDGLTVEMPDKEFQCEDMIVSTLISISPERVFIHTREPQQQIINTIGQIFENRTSICTNCPHCRRFLGKKNRNLLYP